MIRAAAFLVAWLAPAWAGEPPPFEPSTGYASREVEGWTVLINKRFQLERPELAARALRLLRSQLEQVARRLPGRAVEGLRRIKVWLEDDEPHHPCMAYHPDARWLKDHGMNPDKARGVEIANASNFLAWTIDQPWMVLHELAHGYHDQILENGFQNEGVKAAFGRAMEAGSYRSVLRSGGRMERAYATTNPMEYFAEGTEAYFGVNDFYPFVRAELGRHDPGLAALLGRAWGDGAE